MLSTLRVSFPSANDLEALIMIRAAFQLERDLSALVRRAQDRADADRRRDLVAYDEVLREMDPEIANKEARPPIEARQRVDAAVAKLLTDVGYDTGRAA